MLLCARSAPGTASNTCCLRTRLLTGVCLPSSLTLMSDLLSCHLPNGPCGWVPLAHLCLFRLLRLCLRQLHLGPSSGNPMGHHAECFRAGVARARTSCAAGVEEPPMGSPDPCCPGQGLVLHRPSGPLLDFALHAQVAQRANLQSPPIVIREEAYPLLYFAYRLGAARTAIYSPGGLRLPTLLAPLLLWSSSLLACHLQYSPMLPSPHLPEFGISALGSSKESSSFALMPHGFAMDTGPCVVQLLFVFLCFGAVLWMLVGTCGGAASPFLPLCAVMTILSPFFCSAGRLSSYLPSFALMLP